MGFGRPQEYDRNQVAIDMLEWAKDEDSINVNKFCALHDPIIPPRTLLNWIETDENFRRAYECVKSFIAFRREEMLNEDGLHQKAYDANLTVYDMFVKNDRIQDELRKHEMSKQILEHQSKLQEKGSNRIQEEFIESATKLMDQLSSLQSARNIAESNKSNER